MTPQERRQFVRLNARLLTFVKVVETGKVQRALTQNISGIGLRVATDRVFAPGTMLELEVRLPDRAAPITLTASVVWSLPRPGAHRPGDSDAADTGLKFAVVEAKDRAAILQYALLNTLPEDLGRQ